MVFSISDLLLDKGVLQSLVDTDALGWVQHQRSIQQVLQLHYLLPLVLRQPLASYHVCQQVFGGVDGAHHCHLLLKGVEQQKYKTFKTAIKIEGHVKKKKKNGLEARKNTLPFQSLCLLQCTRSSNSDRSAGL